LKEEGRRLMVVVLVVVVALLTLLLLLLLLAIIQEYYPWLANYLVQKRISSHANLHTMYMSFIDKLEAPGLTKQVSIGDSSQ